MSILVSGASGFVGAHVVEALSSAGLGPVVAANLAPPPDVGMLPPAVQVTLDVTDHAAVRAAFDAWRPSLIVHAAAITPSLEEEAADMGRIVAVNVAGAANMIEAAIGSGQVRRLVVFSSSAVYNGLAAYPDVLREDGPLPAEPASLYAATKLACEGMVHRAAAAGRQACAIRVASVYGERERATHSRKSARLSLMHRLAKAAADGVPVRIGCSQAGRDWVHGADVGAAVVNLLKCESLGHRIYNVGSGVAAPFDTIVDLFVQAGLRVTADAEAPLIGMADGDHRPPLSMERLAADVGFAAGVSLADGVAALVAYHRGAGR